MENERPPPRNLVSDVKKWDRLYAYTERCTAQRVKSRIVHDHVRGSELMRLGGAVLNVHDPTVLSANPLGLQQVFGMDAMRRQRAAVARRGAEAGAARAHAVGSEAAAMELRELKDGAKHAMHQALLELLQSGDLGGKYARAKERIKEYMYWAAVLAAAHRRDARSAELFLPEAIAKKLSDVTEKLTTITKEFSDDARAQIPKRLSGTLWIRDAMRMFKMDRLDARDAAIMKKNRGVIVPMVGALYAKRVTELLNELEEELKTTKDESRRGGRLARCPGSSSALGVAASHGRIDTIRAVHGARAVRATVANVNHAAELAAANVMLPNRGNNAAHDPARVAIACAARMLQGHYNDADVRTTMLLGPWGATSAIANGQFDGLRESVARLANEHNHAAFQTARAPGPRDSPQARAAAALLFDRGADHGGRNIAFVLSALGSAGIIPIPIMRWMLDTDTGDRPHRYPYEWMDMLHCRHPDRCPVVPYIFEDPDAQPRRYPSEWFDMLFCRHPDRDPVVRPGDPGDDAAQDDVGYFSRVWNCIMGWMPGPEVGREPDEQRRDAAGEAVQDTVVQQVAVLEQPYVPGQNATVPEQPGGTFNDRLQSVQDAFSAMLKDIGFMFHKFHDAAVDVGERIKILERNPLATERTNLLFKRMTNYVGEHGKDASFSISRSNSQGGNYDLMFLNNNIFDIEETPSDLVPDEAQNLMGNMRYNSTFAGLSSKVHVEQHVETELMKPVEEEKVYCAAHTCTESTHFNVTEVNNRQNSTAVGIVEAIKQVMDRVTAIIPANYSWTNVADKIMVLLGKHMSSLGKLVNLLFYQQDVDKSLQAEHLKMRLQQFELDTYTIMWSWIRIGIHLIYGLYSGNQPMTFYLWTLVSAGILLVYTLLWYRNHVEVANVFAAMLSRVARARRENVNRDLTAIEIVDLLLMVAVPMVTYFAGYTITNVMGGYRELNDVFDMQTVAPTVDQYANLLLTAITEGLLSTVAKIPYVGAMFRPNSWISLIPRIIFRAVLPQLLYFLVDWAGLRHILAIALIIYWTYAGIIFVYRIGKLAFSGIKNHPTLSKWLLIVGFTSEISSYFFESVRSFFNLLGGGSIPRIMLRMFTKLGVLFSPLVAMAESNYMPNFPLVESMIIEPSFVPRLRAQATQ